MPAPAIVSLPDYESYTRPPPPTVSPLTQHTEGLSKDVPDVGSQLHMLEPRHKGRKNP